MGKRINGRCSCCFLHHSSILVKFQPYGQHLHCTRSSTIHQIQIKTREYWTKVLYISVLHTLNYCIAVSDYLFLDIYIFNFRPYRSYSAHKKERRKGERKVKTNILFLIFIYNIKHARLRGLYNIQTAAERLSVAFFSFALCTTLCAGEPLACTFNIQFVTS